MDIPLSPPLILLICIAIYIIVLLVLFIILRNLFPGYFVSKAGLNSSQVEEKIRAETQYSMLDLTCLSVCAPCSDCSLRAILRRMCPSAPFSRMRKAMTVDWLRRPIIGEGDGVDLVCCTANRP